MFREMRRFKQAASVEECLAVLKGAKRAVLSVHGEDGYPYGVPVNFYYHADDGKIYIHSAVTGHKVDALKADSRVCLTTWSGDSLDEDGWSYHTVSVIVFGRADEVTDDAVRRDILRRLGEKYFPEGSDQEIASDIHRNLSRTLLLAITPDHMTGKRVHEK